MKCFKILMPKSKHLLKIFTQTLFLLFLFKSNDTHSVKIKNEWKI